MSNLQPVSSFPDSKMPTFVLFRGTDKESIKMSKLIDMYKIPCARVNVEHKDINDFLREYSIDVSEIPALVVKRDSEDGSDPVFEIYNSVELERYLYDVYTRMLQTGQQTYNNQQQPQTGSNIQLGPMDQQGVNNQPGVNNRSTGTSQITYGSKLQQQYGTPVPNQQPFGTPIIPNVNPSSLPTIPVENGFLRGKIDISSKLGEIERERAQTDQLMFSNFGKPI